MPTLELGDTRKIAFVYADDRGSNGSPILGHTIVKRHIDPPAGDYACDWYVHATGDHGTADSVGEALAIIRGSVEAAEMIRRYKDQDHE